MWFMPKPEPLPQPIAAAQKTDLEERLEKLERRQKMIDLEQEEWYTKFRTLYARLEKHARAASQGPQDAPGSTITPAEGVAPPPPPARDRWTALRDAKAAASRRPA